MLEGLNLVNYTYFATAKSGHEPSVSEVQNIFGKNSFLYIKLLHENVGVYTNCIFFFLVISQGNHENHLTDMNNVYSTTQQLERSISLCIFCCRPNSCPMRINLVYIPFNSKVWFLMVWKLFYLLSIN